MAWREFHFQDGSSNKFWKIELSGDSHTVHYGRIGTHGQQQTKSFADDAKAKKDYDKLVAEKVKKGYVEIGGSGGSSTATTAPPAAAPAPKAAKAKPAGEGEAPAEPTRPPSPAIPRAAPKPAIAGTAEVRHELKLDPIDWFWAMWRDPDPLPPPAPPEFDQADRIARIRNYKKAFPFPARSFIRADSVSPAEAHFWLTAVVTQTGSYGNRHFQELAGLLEKQTFDGKLTLEASREMLTRAHTQHAREVALCLSAIFSAEELFELIVGEWTLSDHRGQRTEKGWGIWILPGVQHYVIPYLPRPARAALRTHVKAHLKGLTPPAAAGESSEFAPWAFAGILGMAEEVARLIAPWADGSLQRYQHAYSHILSLMGLASGEEFRRAWRRLGLNVDNFQRYYGWSGGLEPDVWIRAWLAHTELSDLDMIRDTIASQPSKEPCEELLSPFAELVDAAEAAPAMLALSQNCKTPRIARLWLEARPATAIAGLLPLIVAGDPLAADAVTFLQDQRHAGAGEVVEAQIAALPTEDAQKVRAALSGGDGGKSYEELTAETTPAWLTEALEELAKLKPVAGADFVATRRLPPITIDGRKLTADQTSRLLIALQKSPLDAPPRLFALLREHADRTSLDAFAWALFEQWVVEANSKQKWAMYALGHLGGDQVALKLTPLLRKWPGESQHQRAVTGLDVLRAIGSDTALMQLNGVAQKVKFKGIKQKAQEYMEEIATAKGLTKAQLEDRIVPDCDLDERGSRTFDFGPRKFFFTLSSDMKPLVKDENKKVLKDLPKPGAKDDAAQADAAVAEWKLLKAQLREVLKTQVDRLEQAMVTGRRWPLEEFERFLVKHPLMTNLARTVVWATYDANGTVRSTFRVTEEQDYANSQDEPCQLLPGDAIGIVHTLHLDDETRAAWGEVFSDYEIATPFRQLDRPTYSLQPDEEQATELQRFGNVKIPPIALVGILQRLGWQRGIPEDGGVYHEHSKSFPGANVTAIVEYEIGVPIGFMEGWEDQKITRAYIIPGTYAPTIYPDHRNRLKLGEVDPVVVNEVLADLTVVASKGT